MIVLVCVQDVLLTSGMRLTRPGINHPRLSFMKFTPDDVIMMVIESDSRVMTEVTLHTIFIYITLGREDKLDIALIHLLKL